MVAIRFYQPAAELRPYVSSYYLVDAELPDGVLFSDHLHPEWGNIRILKAGRWSASINTRTYDPVPRAMLVGFTSYTVRCDNRHGSFFLVGAGILPAGWARLIDEDASKRADSITPLQSRFGLAADQLVDRIDQAEIDDTIVEALDGFFLGQLHQSMPTPPVLSVALKAIMDPEVQTAEDFAAAIGLSVRQAERISSRYFGFTPKLLLRRQRFLRSLARLSEMPRGAWAHAIDLGYHDQSHFNRDFKRFMGMSPSAYFSSDRPILAKAAMMREKLLGAPVQALHVEPQASKDN